MIWIALLGANIGLQTSSSILLVPVIVAQGLWLYRFYAIGHEASHHKLFDHPFLNDATGSSFLTWFWAPVTIFRHIHYFHHGANRRRAGIATLDTFVISNPKWRPLYNASWYLSVFGTGFFWHSFISILLFLFLPTNIGKKISPAFNGWTSKKRTLSLVEFAICLAVHGTVVGTIGWWGWTLLLGFPILTFAWVWSAMLYIYHYDTTIGKRVQYNVRSLPNHWLLSRLLLNFNHHSVHHHNPSIPWYDLPNHKDPGPEGIRMQNQKVHSVSEAILFQLRGPRIVPSKESNREVS